MLTSLTNNPTPEHWFEVSLTDLITPQVRRSTTWTAASLSPLFTENCFVGQSARVHHFQRYANTVSIVQTDRPFHWAMLGV